jgi:hypothetical protein
MVATLGAAVVRVRRCPGAALAAPAAVGSKVNVLPATRSPTAAFGHETALWEQIFALCAGLTPADPRRPYQGHVGCWTCDRAPSACLVAWALRPLPPYPL